PRAAQLSLQCCDAIVITSLLGILEFPDQRETAPRQRIPANLLRDSYRHRLTDLWWGRRPRPPNQVLFVDWKLGQLPIQARRTSLCQGLYHTHVRCSVVVVRKV